MTEQILDLRKVITTDLEAVHDKITLEQFRLTHMVRKGTIQQLVDELRNVPAADKPAVGKALNDLKNWVNGLFAVLEEKLVYEASQVALFDTTLPSRGVQKGSAHPITQTINRIVDVFSTMGFEVATGPDVEDDEHNFGKLNFADDHPARDMQDTFFVNGKREDLLLRTHTSSVQIRVMEESKPPIRCIMPGRVYRNEAVSARSLAEFHQIEGLYIDKGVSMADLKGTITAFARRFYSPDAKFRFRTSYFPFTEPSAEVDMSCFLCSGAGCRVCKNTGWLEIAGCGMVHPNVLKACGIDPDEYSGFAFGFGVERIVMMLTGIDDIRLLYQNDLRVLTQF